METSYFLFGKKEFLKPLNKSIEAIIYDIKNGESFCLFEFTNQSNPALLLNEAEQWETYICLSAEQYNQIKNYKL